MIIGNEILKVEVEQVMDTVLVYRVLEQSEELREKAILYTNETFYLRSIVCPDYSTSSIYIRGKDSDLDSRIVKCQYNTKEEADNMLSFIKEAVEHICEEYAPKKEKVKLWQFVTHKGNITKQFYSEDLRQIWNGKVLQDSMHCDPRWIRTNNYIEVEVL